MKTFTQWMEGLYGDAPSSMETTQVTPDIFIDNFIRSHPNLSEKDKEEFIHLYVQDFGKGREEIDWERTMNIQIKRDIITPSIALPEPSQRKAAQLFGKPPGKSYTL